jgi:hypothetical protein
LWLSYCVELHVMVGKLLNGFSWEIDSDLYVIKSYHIHDLYIV